MQLADNELLRKWYWMHVMWTESTSEKRRLEECQDMLDHCAKMMATEAILYSEEEIHILTNALEAKEKAER